jgi:hypothetical protein
MSYPDSQKPTKAHRSYPCSKNHDNAHKQPPIAYPKPNQRDQDKPNQNQHNHTQLIVWKIHVAHHYEHDYHDSLHSTEVAQLYPQVGDFITG